MRPAPLLLVCTAFALTACPKGQDDPRDGGLLGIGVSPNDPIVQLDETLQFEAKAFYDDYSNEVITAEVDWVSTDPRVATVDSSGLCTPVAEGSTDVIASYQDGVSAKVELTVSGADVNSVTLSPSAVDVELGQRVQLVASATFSDGSSGNIAGSCDWTSDEAGVAQVDSSGLVTGMGEGSTSIRASYGGMSIDPANITVVAEGTELPDPDIKISSFDASASGDTVSYEVTVTNQGGGYASEFYVDVFLDLDGEPSASDWYDGFAWVPGLAEGESSTLYVDLSEVDAGSYDSYAWADVDGWVSESNEDNNKAGPESVTVSGSGGYPNLEIVGFEGVSDGYSTLYYIEVENTGSGDSGAFYVDLYLDRYDSPELFEDGDYWGQVENLAPGESVVWEPLVHAGPYHHGYSYWESWFMVDSYDQVQETDEDDNVAYSEVWAD